jgi:hypothetical protein
MSSFVPISRLLKDRIFLLTPRAGHVKKLAFLKSAARQSLRAKYLMNRFNVNVGGLEGSGNRVKPIVDNQ